MSEECKKTTLRALHNMLGDDLYRARRAFNGMSEEQLNRQYGESGKTCAQILREYEYHDEAVRAAISWVEQK